MSDGDPAGPTTRIALVEDHPIVRLGLRTLIDAQPDMTVVGEADNARDAVKLTRRLQPTLVILALRLQGDLCGSIVCRELKRLPRRPAVLMYTSFHASEDVSSCFLSGAEGFVSKGTDAAHLLTAIRAAGAGRRIVVPGGRSQASGGWSRHGVADAGLTRREREVLGLMLQHLTNLQIARELHVGLPTVKTHVSSVLRKLGLARRHDLFARTAS